MPAGLAELQRRWGAIPAKVRAAVQAEMEKTAAAVVADMRKAAPKRIGGGKLAASIGWTWGDPPRGAVAIGGFDGGGSSERMRITIYAGGGDVFYARWVEFGTAPHSLTKNASAKRRKRQDTGRLHPGATPRPFFYPVWRIWRRRVSARIARAVRTAIRNA